VFVSYLLPSGAGDGSPVPAANMSRQWSRVLSGGATWGMEEFVRFLRDFELMPARLSSAEASRARPMMRVAFDFFR
jgi:hypothetical protein